MTKPNRVPAPNWTPEQRAEHRSIREFFQREKPTLEQIVAETGVPPTTLGEYLALRTTLKSLRDAREAAGLSLADVAERTGIDKAALSRLETGGNANPTIETLSRYAAAIGKRVRWTIEDVAPSK